MGSIVPSTLGGYRSVRPKRNMHTTYMLDTNVFNDVLDGKIDIACLKGRRLIATHIQRDEIGKCMDETRRRELFSIFEFLAGEHVPTSSFVVGISVVGGACAGSDGAVPTELEKPDSNDNIFDGMRRCLDNLNKGKKSNTQDILIAETSLRNGYVLVTSDAHLFKVVTKYGGACGNALTLQTFSHVFQR